MKTKERLNRAEFLMNWFLEVFEGRKAPFPRYCLKGISFHMKELLKNSKQYKKKYKEAA